MNRDSRRKQFIPAVVIMAAVFTACEGPPMTTAEDTEEAEHAVDQPADRGAIEDLAARHNAVTDWHGPLPLLGPVLTVFVEDALLRQDGRPILLRDMRVEDVTRDQDGYMVHFVSAVSDLSLFLVTIGLANNFDPGVVPNWIRFHLRCPDGVEQILSRAAPSESLGRTLDPTYELVASISAVRKVSAYDIEATVQSEDEVSLETVAKNRFVATGQCLDVYRHPD